MLLRTILMDALRFLTFRSPSAALRQHSSAYLAFGLLLTWAAGVGRYWDAAAATLWQYLGLTSVAYAVLLALLLWLLIAPLGPKNWSYRNVLLFVTLTSPPALLYAIPVEAWLAPSAAHAMNVGFLAIVAIWRLALLFVFLKRVAGLRGSTILVAALLPIALVVDGLALLGFQHLAYETMAGLRDAAGFERHEDGSTAQVICFAAALITPALLAGYGWIAHERRKRRYPMMVTESRFRKCSGSAAV